MRRYNIHVKSEPLFVQIFAGDKAGETLTLYRAASTVLQ